jgi:hypothetical protein
VTVTPTAGSAETVSIGPGPTRRTFGPYTEGATVVMVNSSVGEMDYDRPGGNVATFSDDGLSLVDKAGNELLAIQALIDAGVFALPAGTRLGTIAAVPTASILLDAGSGGTVTTARITFAPPTDTIGAQRLMTPTSETYTLTMDSAIVVKLGALSGIALAMHAIGVSVDAVLTSESYVAESDYTLAEYIAGDARFEWLDSVPTRVRLTLQRGASTRYAVLSAVAEVSA